MTDVMAEREGVEPSIPLLAEYTISNRAPSASRASLRNHFLKHKFKLYNRESLGNADPIPFAESLEDLNTIFSQNLSGSHPHCNPSLTSGTPSKGPSRVLRRKLATMHLKTNQTMDIPEKTVLSTACGSLPPMIRFARFRLPAGRQGGGA